MRIIFVLVFMPMCFKSFAQTVIKKPVTLVKLGYSWRKANLDRYIIDSDTSYQFIFPNDEYSQVIDIKIIKFTKESLKKFAKAFTTAQAAGVGDRVLMDEYSIVKERELGITYFTLYNDGGWLTLYSSSVKKLLETIQKE